MTGMNRKIDNMATKDRFMLIMDESNPAYESANKKLLDYMEWEELQPDPEIPILIRFLL